MWLENDPALGRGEKHVKIRFKLPSAGGPAQLDTVAWGMQVDNLSPPQKNGQTKSLKRTVSAENWIWGRLGGGCVNSLPQGINLHAPSGKLRAGKPAPFRLKLIFAAHFLPVALDHEKS